MQAPMACHQVRVLLSDRTSLGPGCRQLTNPNPSQGPTLRGPTLRDPSRRHRTSSARSQPAERSQAHVSGLKNTLSP